MSPQNCLICLVQPCAQNINKIRNFEVRNVTKSIAISLATTAFSWAWVFPVKAQIVGDGTLPVPTQVTPTSGIDFNITHGTQVGGNLFHSFSQFSVPTLGSAVFDTTQYSGIQNIFSRVTGGSISSIDGLIRATGSANLFLLNPTGILFGANARLQVGGSFIATTGNSVRFADGTEFSANPQAPSLLTMSVPIGVQFGNAPGTIQVNGAGLAVPAGRTLGLLGGAIEINGGALAAAGGTNLDAPAGRIELGSVGGNSLVGVTPVSRGFALSYNGVQAFQPIQLTQAAYASAANINPNDGGGDIQIQGQQVQLSGGSQIATFTTNASGGTLTVNASETVELFGTGFIPGEEIPSGFLNRTLGRGNAGDLIINTRQLVIRDGALVSASTNGAGQGGSLTINAADSIDVSGASATNPGSTFSGISVASNRNATGPAGNLAINTNRLSVRDGGQISATTFGSGRGGNLTVNAINVELVGGSATQVNGLFAQAGSSSATSNNPNATGQGGNLTVNTETLLVQNGSRISTGTFTAGSAGNLTINAAESVRVVGRSPSDLSPSTLSAGSVSAGAAGNLSIATRELRVEAGGTIAVSATGTGVAGDLQIVSPFIQLNNQGVLTAETRAGQGNISLVSSDVRLRRNSLISTNATGTATGGNISISTQTLVALENSDITANAQESFGGRVSIQTAAIFGTAFRAQLTPESDITATSALGPQFSGLVTIQTPGIDPSQGIVQLQSDVIDISSLVVQACSPESQRTAGEFFITGRGGLPPSPTDPIAEDQIQVDLGQPLPDRAASLPPVPPGEFANQTDQPLTAPLLQAQGWTVNAQRKVVLVAQSSSISAPMTGLILPPCKTP